MGAADDEDNDPYKAYVIRKWFRGEHARSRDDYQRERDKFARSKEFGDQFRDGMCKILGRTEERGWQKESYFKTEHGRRYHDSANAKFRHAMEFKAGRVGEDALLQLEKDAVALELGYRIEWYTAPNARIIPEVADRLEQLQAKYPGRFVTVEVSKEQFAQAIEIGRSLARERENDARTRDMVQALARSRDLTAAREVVRQAIEAQARDVAQARLDGRTLDLTELRDSHTRLTAGLDKIRELERQDTRDQLTASGLAPAHVEKMVPILEENRDRHRLDLTAGLTSIGKEVRQREWADELEQHNQQAKALGRQQVREARGPALGRDQEPPALAVERDARELEIDPARVVELDLDKYRAVRDGRHLGWDSQGRVHTYQVSGKPPVRVAHDDEERRMAELTKNLNKGLTLEEIRTRELMDLSQAQPIQEAARTRSIDPPGMDLTRADELTRERERQQERERGGRERW